MFSLADIILLPFKIFLVPGSREVVSVGNPSEPTGEKYKIA